MWQLLVLGIYNATYKEVIALAAKALQVSAEDTVLVYSGAIIPSEENWRIGKYLEDSVSVTLQKRKQLGWRQFKLINFIDCCSMSETLRLVVHCHSLPRF